MTEWEKSLRKKRIILNTTILAVILGTMGYILLNSTLNDTLYFHYVHNRNTGEPLGLITSLLLYVLFWWWVGLVPSAAMFVLALLLSSFLYRKDKKLRDEEFYTGGALAIFGTYAAILVLMISHISNAATINI